MIPAEYCNLNFPNTIKKWDEAVPLGNGDLGCLIWGGPSALRFSIDKGDLWDCTGGPVAGGEYTYRNLIRLVKKKRQREIVRIFDLPYYKATPTKLPAGKIILDLKTSGNVKSSLRLSDASAAVETGGVVLNSFISASRPLGMIRINSTDCEFQIEPPAYGDPDRRHWKKWLQNKKAISQSLKNICYEPSRSEKIESGGACTQYFIQTIPGDRCYGIFLYILRRESETVAAYTVGLGAQEQQLISACMKRLKEAVEEGYDSVFQEHAKWWTQFWNKSDLKIPDQLLEKNWYLGNYLLGSCSRKGYYPMPLQGVWTADNGELPPWKGDYHHDLNTELCYSSYAKANHLEEGECLIDYLFQLEDQAKKFAAAYFEAPGMCLPGVMDLQGNPLGGWPMYALSPTNQLWLCHLIKKHSDYLGDQAFLEQKVYPYIKECAKLILALLVRDENGELTLPLSSSPEIHDNTLKAWLAPNSNYDLALMRCLFEDLYHMSIALNLEADQEIWENTLAALAPLYTDTDGCLKINRYERLQSSHRHFSHLMSIHPLRTLRYDNEEHQKGISASIRDLERLGPDHYVGYSYAWLANLYTVEKNGQKARDTLHLFFRYFCSPNGFHLNGDFQDQGYSKLKYRPFTLEGNFCALDALQEMLLYSENGMVCLCPAIPEEWENLSFTLRAQGGVMVSAKVEHSKAREVTLTAQSDLCIVLSGAGIAEKKVMLRAGVPERMEFEQFDT